MRCGPNDKFWMVIDPTPRSELADVLFETTLRGLALQLAGGLSMDRNPTMFGGREEARREAEQRLAAAQRCLAQRRT
jgi:hypothetical protein